MHVIVSIFEQLVPISGGGTPRIRSIIDALVKRGHDVSVTASLAAEVEDARKMLRCKELIRLKNISRLDKNKMIKYSFFHPLNISKVTYEAIKMKPDLIIAHNSIAGFASLLSKKATGCKAVIDLTDLLFEYLPSYSKMPWLDPFQKIGGRIENKVLSKADKIITISNAMKKILIQRRAKQKNIDVVYDGVNIDIFKPRNEAAVVLRQNHAGEAEHVVMFHGVIDPQDQPKIIVEAAIIVLKQYPKTMFWIIGDGAAIPTLKEEVKNANIKNHFFFSGWIPFEDIPSFISACDVGLVVLPNTISARIRLTLKGFEYWACEKPIVASELPALKEIVEEGRTGLFYKPEDPKDLAEKVCLLLDDKFLSKRMGRKGREIVEKNYSWRKLADEFVTICENMFR
jgi:glycosyltransferase involved in cell wall biosynthesis